MPASNSSNANSQPKDCTPAFDSTDAANEFNRNFNQSLLGLKALNSQTGQEITFSELLSCRMERTDDDVVILDDTQHSNLLQKTSNGMDPKANKFTINENIRNVFKGIMSNVKNAEVTKSQENENTLPKLLAQTKSIGLESRDKTNNIHKNSQQNGVSDKCPGNNLFENLQDIHSSSETQESKSDNKSTNGAEPKPDVIELDDSLEDDFKSTGNLDGHNSESKDELDIKEEDKLLQLDSDVVELPDTGTHDDLKLENKLLELDNENSNQSVTSIKSNHSERSNHSVKSDYSINSVKSVNSKKSMKNNEVNSERSSDTSNSLKCQNENSDSVSNFNDCSNHSIKSNISIHSEKSDKSIHSEKSVLSSHSLNSEKSHYNSNSASSDHIDLVNESVKSDIDNNCESDSRGRCTESESLKSTFDDHLKSKNDISDNEKEEKNNDQSAEETTRKLSKDHSEASLDSKTQTSEGKDENMEVESEEENGELSETLKNSMESKDEGTNEHISIKEEDCDSDTKTVKNDLSKQYNEKNENNTLTIDKDRKRPADSDNSVSSEPKRTRLDEVIGKLGSQIGIPLDRVKTMEELSDTDASHMDSEVTESKSEETSTDTDGDDDDDEDVMKLKSLVKSSKKARRVSQKELSMIVKARVMLYLRTYRDETIKDLHRKIDDLQKTNDVWKNKAKELERRMLEFTILQQKHEKRKAKTAALRQISCKSIGVQVDENKVEKQVNSPPNHVSKEIAQQQSQNHSTSNKSGVKTPPRSSAQSVSQASPKTSTTPMLQSPPVVTLPVKQFIPIASNLTPLRTTTSVSTPQIQQALNQLPMQKILLSPPLKPGLQNELAVGQYPCNKTVKSLLDTSRQQPQQQKPVMKNTTVFIPTTNIPKVGQLPQQQLIMVTSTPSIPTLTAASTNIPATTAVSNVTKASAKVIDLTDEEETAAKQTASQGKVSTIPNVVSTIPPQGIIRSLTPQTTTLPQQSILLSGPAGTRFVNPTQQQYQLVFNSGASAIPPGSLVTVVSAPNTPGIRPSVGSQQTTVPPPQLRAAQLVPLTAALPRTSAPATTMVPGVQQQMLRVVRPPPPLQSAPSNQNNQTRPQIPPKSTQVVNPPTAPKAVHPAPLPTQDPPVIKPGEKPLAPKPTLKISRVSQGIVLSWNMTYIAKNHAEIQSYQLFAYQETAAPATPSLWKKVGDVKALPLPMACTLTQFQEGNRYHFAVRPVDVHSRPGPFSEPSSIHLMPMK